jgi:hypothetical protein
MMRRLTIALLATCLLTIGAGGAVAQSPSPSPVEPGPPYPEPIDGMRVYDYAGVLSDDTITSVEATIRAIEERSGAQVVVYSQVKPESDTFEEAERDAVALIDQWGVGRADIDDGLAILFDLEANLCHGQVQMYAAPGYAAAYLTDEERQAIFEQDMLPALRDCDIDAALLAAMERIDAATKSDGSTLGGQRVEVPEAGIALTFPDDWAIEEVTAAGNEGTTSVLDPEMSGLLTTVVAAVPPTMHDRCVVVDFTLLVRSNPDWTSLDDVIAGFLLLMEDDPRWVGLESTFMDLPAGRTGRILRAVDSEAEFVSTYYFTDSDAWFYLECVSHEIPRADWLSIADTFEFPPDED